MAPARTRLPDLGPKAVQGDGVCLREDWAELTAASSRSGPNQQETTPPRQKTADDKAVRGARRRPASECRRAFRRERPGADGRSG
jgi:hypothetical protein